MTETDSNKNLRFSKIQTKKLIENILTYKVALS